MLARLRKELRDLEQGNASKETGITVELITISEDICECKAIMEGIDGTPYEGGVYILNIKCSKNYPFIPPEIKFETPIYHVSVNNEGCINCDMLTDRWSPAITLNKALLNLRSCMAIADAFEHGNDPQSDSTPLDVMQNDMIQYCKNAVNYNHKYADGLSLKQRGLDGYHLDWHKWYKNPVEYFIMTYYDTGNFYKVLAVFINEYSGNVYEPYLPFPSYQPWVEFCKKREANSVSQQNKRRNPRKRKLEDTSDLHQTKRQRLH